MCNYHVRPGVIKIQIQVQYFPNMESPHLLEYTIAIYIAMPHLYFDGMQVTRSFGGSYAPDVMYVPPIMPNFIYLLGTCHYC